MWYMQFLLTRSPLACHYVGMHAYCIAGYFQGLEFALIEGVKK